MSATNFAHPTKTRFVVIRENILGSVHPKLPDWAGVLTSSLVRGATHHWTDGAVCLIGEKQVRPATPEDFRTFNMDPAPYLKDTAYYDFPATSAA